ncbi:Putative acyl-CoA dehydrogenase AidB [Durusdinium trenchii]|uniref:Acyl-CoA dehydrogenase AidB n=1 Tax=Durusdinium trenchii TaxID=1381693 RepID=A0ABP0I384_9DINO
MAFGAGRFWGDDGAGTGALEDWDPWPLQKLWRQGAELEQHEEQQDHEDPQDAVEDLHEEQVKDQRHAVVQQEDQVDAPPPAARRARIDPSAVRRMVSSHMARDREPLEPVEPEGGQGGNLWANWLPGRAAYDPQNEPWDARARPAARPERLWEVPQWVALGVCRGGRMARESVLEAAFSRQKRRPGGGRVRLSKELSESWTTREVLRASEKQLEDGPIDQTCESRAEFDLVHAVVALHRIAKSTDYRELQDDARRRSGGRRSGADASELRGQLAALAAKAAEEVLVSFMHEPPTEEPEHVDVHLAPHFVKYA